MITYGTNPGMGVSITGALPDPGISRDARERESVNKALRYMGLEGGKPLLGHAINVVFIGSCTNSRITRFPHCGRGSERTQSEPAMCG